MIIKSQGEDSLYSGLDEIGLKESIAFHKSVLLKINMARPAEPEHPRTDTDLLAKVINYVYLNNGTCAIAECANGYLRRNLEISGLKDTIDKHSVEVIDLDLEEVEKVIVSAEEHYIPKCLNKFGVRIGIPSTSKRAMMIFSNNVKLFVGAVPRRMYQIGDDKVDWRPRIHLDLHNSVANIFSAIQEYSSFDFFINGGLAMDERKGEFTFENTLVSNDGVELDLYVLENYFSGHEVPEYLKMLVNK